MLSFWRFGSPITLSFPVPRDTAITRLKNATKTPPLLHIPADPNQSSWLVGSVTGSHVKLHRAQPFRSNIFRPVFYGTINTHQSSTVISGEFIISKSTQYATIASSALFLLVGLVIALTPQPTPLQSLFALFAAPILLFVQFAIVIVGRHINASDVDWITDQIRDALGTNT